MVFIRYSNRKILIIIKDGILTPRVVERVEVINPQFYSLSSFTNTRDDTLEEL